MVEIFLWRHPDVQLCNRPGRLNTPFLLGNHGWDWIGLLRLRRRSRLLCFGRRLRSGGRRSRGGVLLNRRSHRLRCRTRGLPVVFPVHDASSKTAAPKNPMLKRFIQNAINAAFLLIIPLLWTSPAAGGQFRSPTRSGSFHFATNKKKQAPETDGAYGYFGELTSSHANRTGIAGDQTPRSVCRPRYIRVFSWKLFMGKSHPRPLRAEIWWFAQKRRMVRFFITVGGANARKLFRLSPG